MAKQQKTKTTATREGSPPSQDASKELKDWHCIAVITIAAALYFHELLFNTAYLWEDFLYSSYPARSFAAVSMAMGQMPLWNPYTFSGMPFFADIVNMVFYLPCTALVLFVRDGRLDPYWLQLVVLMHYLLAGVGMFYLAKSFSVKRVAALFAGVAYMITGFMVMRAIHLPVLALAAWLPLIILAFRKTLLDEHWRWVFVAALVIGHSILAGFPQLSLYIYFFLFALFLFEVLTTYRGKALVSRAVLAMAARAATVVLLSLALAAVQLLPTVELSDLSQRAQITYAKSTEGSLAWSQLTTLLFPKFFGSAGAQGYNYWGPGPYWHFWETCVYLGVLPLLFMIFSLNFARGNKYVPFLWGVAGLAFLYALGNNFFLQKFLFDYVPGFSRFRIPARIGIFISVAAALLSAFALQHVMLQHVVLQHVMEDARSKAKTRRILFGVIAVGVVFWLMLRVGMLSVSFLDDRNTASLVGNETNLSLGIILVSGAVVYFMLKSHAVPRWTLAAAIAVTFLDLYLFAGQQNNSKTNPSEYFRRTESLVEFIKKESAGEFFRVNTRNSQGILMDRNQGMVDRIFITEGYTPLALQRLHFPFASGDQVFDLLNVKYKTVTDEQAGTLRLVPHPTYFPRAFFLYSIHVVQTEEELLAYVNSPAFDHHTTAVLEKNPGFVLPPASDKPQSKAVITRYENNLIALNVETSDDGLLVLGEPYFPGWKAYVDGQETEIYRTDYNLRGFFVSKGEHRVEVKYEPDSYRKGGMITIASLLLCGGGLLAPLVRRKMRPAESGS